MGYRVSGRSPVSHLCVLGVLCLAVLALSLQGIRNSLLEGMMPLILSIMDIVPEFYGAEKVPFWRSEAHRRCVVLKHFRRW